MIIYNMDIMIMIMAMIMIIEGMIMPCLNNTYYYTPSGKLLRLLLKMAIETEDLQMKHGDVPYLS